MGQIQGIDLSRGKEPQTIAQFVDDTLLSIVGEEAFIQAMVNTLQQFCLASGLVIYEGKSTTYFWHNVRENKLEWTYRFRW